MRLWSKASPWTRARQPSTRSPQVGGDGEEHRPATDGGGEEVQDTDGVPRSKLGLWGT